MPFNKKSYDQQYNRENVITKRVPFNRLQPDDMELLAHAESTGNFTAYVKALIRADLERSGKQGDPGAAEG